MLGGPVDAVTPEEIGRLALSDLTEIPADLQGTAEYRRRVGATMVARAFEQARTQATEGAVDA